MPLPFPQNMRARFQGLAGNSDPDDLSPLRVGA